MIQLTPQMRLLVALEPVDFRKGIDGLGAVCRQQLEQDPFSGTLFVFVNRSRQSLRILAYDGQGYWLCHKRLSRGRFVWNFDRRQGPVRELAVRQLQMLLWNGDPWGINPEEYRPLKKMGVR
jgi:transposase